MKPLLRCTLCGSFEEGLTASVLSGTTECICAACEETQRALFEPVCDFCTGRPVEWTHPTESYVVPLSRADRAAIPKEIVVTSNEDWAACEVCHALIETDQWDQLVTRSADAYVAGHHQGWDDRASIIHSLKLLHGKFREYRTGKAYRESGGKGHGYGKEGA